MQQLVKAFTFNYVVKVKKSESSSKGKIHMVVLDSRFQLGKCSPLLKGFLHRVIFTKWVSQLRSKDRYL